MVRKSCFATEFAHKSLIAVTATALTLALAPTAMAEQGVVMTGVQVDYADWTNESDVPFTIGDFCDNRNIIENEVSKALGAVEQAIAEEGWAVPLSAIENIPNMPTRSEIATDVDRATTALCEDKNKEDKVYVFTITYSSCRMGMTTPSNAMVIFMPDGTDTATMLAADHNTQEVVHFEMTAWLEESNKYTGPGWSDQISISSTGETAEIFGYETEHFTFSSEGGLGETEMRELGEIDIEAGQINNQQRLGNLVKVTSKGNAWISDSAPGIDIVRSFYQNLTSRFRPDAGAANFMSGLINNMVGILDKGIPIVIEQEVKSSVMGRTMGGGKSEAHVANIRLWDLPPNWCTADLGPPEGYTETDINEAMSDADMPSSAEVAAGMQQYQEAMEGLTDEQKQMLQNMGMGDMMQQMMGGANPAAGQQAAAATAASGAAASSKSGSGMPPADELNSGSLTESVQKHLQALGYDVGEVNGEASLQTTIAISTFQAEKGMEVTGEVTPQLLGVLSAEVDGRRGK